MPLIVELTDSQLSGGHSHVFTSALWILYYFSSQLIFLILTVVVIYGSGFGTLRESNVIPNFSLKQQAIEKSEIPTEMF